MKNLQTATDLEGKVILVRVGSNVPLLENREIENDFRIKAFLPTIDFLVEQKAKVVLLGHLGRKLEDTLEPVFKYLQNFYQNKGNPCKVYFNQNTFKKFGNNSEKDKTKISKIEDKIGELKNGEILLLDNLRQTELEKKNDGGFKKVLRSLGDVYIQEAFANSHREHASMTIKPDYYGFQYEKEIKNLEKVLQPESPSIFILGGAKMQTKIPLLEKALEKYDYIFVGGAIANTFYQHIGFEIGDSLVEDIDKNILEKILTTDGFILPDTVIVERDGKKITLNPGEVMPGDRILDIAPEFFDLYQEEFQEAKFIFMNGPLGYYEGGYTKGTEKVLQMSASPDNFFLAGGGNTAAAIFKLGLEKNTDFISTGGGALIHFLIKE